MGTSERREREKQKRRQDILSAARQLFVEKGLRSTTIDDIARSTELARGTIYLYFETKEDIYATILMDGLDILQSLLEESQDSSVDPLTNLLNGHDAYMRFHDEYALYNNVLFLTKMESADLIPKATQDLIDAKTDYMARWIAARLDEGVRLGMFHAMDTLQVAYLQMAIATGFSIMLDKCGRGSSPIADREQAKQAMHSLIANGVMRRNRTSP